MLEVEGHQDRGLRMALVLEVWSFRGRLTTSGGFLF